MAGQISRQNNPKEPHRRQRRNLTKDNKQPDTHTDDTAPPIRGRVPGRVIIDAMDVLHIRNLTVWDSGIYSCLQENKVKASIKVKG